MKELLIEPHYLGCIEYFGMINRYDKVVFEIHETFPKQTYRNRTYILGSNKVIALSIPLTYSNRTIFKDIRIDHSQRWTKDHWGAITSSYGKAPFFEFFADAFKNIWEAKHEFLLDLDIKMMNLCFKLANVKVEVDFTNTYEKVANSNCEDFRNQIHPKIDSSSRNLYELTPYKCNSCIFNKDRLNQGFLDKKKP
jgi:hypothetical protein